jgi:hypothetical protein
MGGVEIVSKDVKPWREAAIIGSRPAREQGLRIMAKISLT